MDKIPGGYYIKARKIQNSDVAIAPPHVREIWDWLIKEANHKDQIVHGTLIKRGQLIRSYHDIQEGLHWLIGFRKKTYTKWQCEFAMKWLTKHKMITTRKTTRGLFITICNYSYYQNPSNYESHNESHNDATMMPQGTDTINKNDKNDKKKEKESKEKERREFYSQRFETIWKRYPKKDGRKQALKHFMASVKTDEDWRNINKALDNYINYLIEQRTTVKYIKAGSTWFNNWQDWLEKQKDYRDILLEKIPRVGHGDLTDGLG